MTLDAATALTWLADHFFRVSALIVVVGLASVLARRASAHGRLFAWTVVLYTAAAMPLLAAVLPDLPVPVVFEDPVIVVPGRDAGIANPLLAVGDDVPRRQSLLALPWLFWAYVAGTGLLTIRLIAGTHLTARVLRRARPADDATLAAEVQALSSAMKLPHVPRVLQHKSVHVPFVCGLLRPALVLPDGWRAWDVAARHAVLTHELSHLVRRDLWTMRVASLYCAVTWINPLSWWLRRRIDALADCASDDAVLASGVEPTAYAEMLVQFFDAAQRAPGRAAWQLAMARRSGVQAQKRVGRILNAREGGSMRFGMPGRVLVGVGVVLAAVPTIAISASRPDAVAIQAPPVVYLGLEAQADLRTVTPSPLQAKRLEVKAVPQEQEQEQEPEPWRSTRKATDRDVVMPRLTKNVHPKYTPEAMRAKIQGSVAVEVIVSPEGDVSAARILTSLDKEFGLDDEALKAAWHWKFLPGTHQGQPVAVRARIEMVFQLH